MEPIIIHTKNKKRLSLIQKTKATGNPYNSEFVAKMRESRKQAREGKTVKINLDDISDPA